MSDILGVLRTAAQLNQIAGEHFDIVGAIAERGVTVWVLLAMRKGDYNFAHKVPPKEVHSYTLRDSLMVRCQAHNLETVIACGGSSPPPATI